MGLWLNIQCIFRITVFMTLSPDYLQENERTVMDTIMDVNDYEGKINTILAIFKLI